MSGAPHRAALALAWVPGLLLLTAPAGADDARRAPWLACRTLVEDAARLACYDREADAIAATPPAPAPEPARHAIAPTETFGLPPQVVARKEVEAAGIKAAPEVDSIAARVVGLALGENGRVIFTLDNGQVWRQLMAEADPMIKLGDTVKLTRGIVGSFFMKGPGGRTFKVSRLR